LELLDKALKLDAEDFETNFNLGVFYMEAHQRRGSEIAS